MAGSASTEYYSPYNNISIRKLRENRASRARREKQRARAVLTSRAAMLMGEGKKILLTVMITHREDIDLDHFIVHRVNDADVQY